MNEKKKNLEKRFNYYIKNWVKTKIIKIPEFTRHFKYNTLIYYTGKTISCPEHFPKNVNKFWKDKFWFPVNELKLDIPCLTISGDGIDNCQLPAIVKVRNIDDPNGGIIGALEYVRHWKPILNLKNQDIIWNNKKSECVWRGSPTGINQNNTGPPEKWTNIRLVFCHKWYKIYNIGITKTGINGMLNTWNTKYVKNSMNIEELLKYKYIISIPGNDKDTGLNWKLASNSLVLMAKPKIESWLMEGLLKPWFHYVPLSNDYSDLDKKIDWCKKNDKKCQQIVKQANQFMKQFKDINHEIKIFNKIKQHYLKNFILI